MGKKPYGPLNQAAYVVKDIDAAIDFWTGAMGVGPFFKFPPLVAAGGDFRGQPYLPNYAAAIAYSGDLSIELIQPLGGPSMFQEFQDAGRTGVQHLCVFTDNFAKARAAVLAQGAKQVLSNVYPDGSELAYFDMGGDQGVILEIAYLQPPVVELFAAIKAAGANWDGVAKTVSF